jgi:predicted acyltransferase
MGVTGKCAICGVAFRVSEENSKPAPIAAPRPERAAPKKAVAVVHSTGRIESMDQLRGYAIFGMILVDYLGNFHSFSSVLAHHNDRYSYADTIAPLFLFVVGMGFRLSLARRIERDGLWEARWAALKRYLTLFLVGIFFYGPNFRKDWWDALTEIALAGILTLPFIDKKAPVRIVAGLCYLGLYACFFLMTGYGEWLHESSMNGGPLGSLGSAFVLLCGTIAYDLLESSDSRAIVTWSLALGAGLCVASLAAWRIMPADYGSYVEYGPYWPFAKRWMAAPFQLVSTGLCFLTFLAFYWLCDVNKFRFPHLSVLGENPLVIYLVQYSLFEMNETYIHPAGDSSDVPVALIGFVCVYMFCYAVAKRLHDQKYLIKL